MSLLDNAKSLRRTMTDAEQKLWYHLRAHRFMGRKFKRQKPLGRYVVDFVCLEEKLVIELDGGQHAENLQYDQERDAWLRNEGYTVLRFWNNQLMNETESVLERIRLALSPSPSPTSVRGERTLSTDPRVNSTSGLPDSGLPTFGFPVNGRGEKV